MALLAQSADCEGDGTALLIHSEVETVESVSLTVSDSEAEAEADADGYDELSPVEVEVAVAADSVPAEEEVSLADTSVADSDSLGGLSGTCPVGGTQMILVEVMSTTTVVVAVMGNPLSSSKTSMPRACW